MAIDPPISNYRPADHLSEEYLLLLKMLIAFWIRLLSMCVLCNTNEEVFIAGSALQVISRKLFGSAAGMFCRGFALVRVRACTKGPLGEFVFLYLCLSGDFFVANTHFITLTLIKNTWPCSRGQSVHKSAQCSVQHLASKALWPLLLRS